MQKINYQLNVLFSVSDEDGRLIDALSESEDLPIFQTDLIKDFIDFKFETYAYKVHRFGLTNHMFDILLSSLYIRAAYLNQAFMFEPEEFKAWMLYLWYIALIYPTIYDSA